MFLLKKWHALHFVFCFADTGQRIIAVTKMSNAILAVPEVIICFMPVVSLTFEPLRERANNLEFRIRLYSYRRWLEA